MKNKIRPTFSWKAGPIVIYHKFFQVLSDSHSGKNIAISNFFNKSRTFIHTSMMMLAQITFKNVTSMLRILRSVCHRFPSYSKLLWIPPSFFSAQCLSKCMSVLRRHQIVQNWIDSGGQVVQKARNVIEILVQSAKYLGFFEIYVSESLSMKWSPTKEKCQNYSGWKK